MKSATRGNLWEGIVKNHLVFMGLKHVRKIETGMMCIGNRWIHSKKVDGDFTAIGPGGRMVLVEVKAYPDRLKHSALKPHQIKNLDDVVACGGISLLAWCNTKTRKVHMLPWPIEGFGPRTALTPESIENKAIRHVDSLPPNHPQKPRNG